MNYKVPKKSKLKKGMIVSIETKENQGKGKYTVGKISEFLTKNEIHPYGIKVKLESGEIGRVKLINNKNFIQNSILNYEKETEINYKKIISEGENNFIEFKSSVLWSQNISDKDLEDNSSKQIKKYKQETSKIIIAKSIVSFLNSEGGFLIIGIKENKTLESNKIIGIESEFKKLKNGDFCVDGYRRMLLDEIIIKYLPSEIYNHFNKYIQFFFPTICEKTLCFIKINKSDIPVYLKYGKFESFYVRIDAESRELFGSDILNYSKNHFI